MQKYKAISLFSGAGGMDLGLINAGFDIVWANDIEADAVATYKHNISDHIIQGDITNILSEDIPTQKNEVDLIIGGFPCQGFSIANKNRGMQDSRNFLYLQMLRILRDKKPKFFIAENVKGILSIGNGKIIKMIKSDFEGLGYHVDVKVLNAADFGIPQQRERVIIMGNRLGIDNPYPSITHYDLFPGEDNYSNLVSGISDCEKYKPYVTVEESIGFLADIPLQNRLDNFKNPLIINDRIVYNHIASTKVENTFWGRKFDVSQHEICDYLRYWRDKSGYSTKKVDEHFGYKYTAGHWFRKDNNSGSIPNPSDWWELKKIFNFDDKYDKKVTELILKDIKFEQSLRITNWNRASDTITATSPEIHINKKRRLSARECAILQTFPDSFVFMGSLNSQYRQIGNAVPVKLAEKLGIEIIKSLNRMGEHCDFN